MSYNYIVNAKSYIGDSLDNVNEGFFADNISSFSRGTCENSEEVFKSLGKKHIFCVVDSTDRSGKICNLLRNILSSKGQGKVRVKFQYDLKEMVENIFSGDETKCASFLYGEGKNIFVAGYNEVFVYKYSKSTGGCEKITFPVAPEAHLTEEDVETPSRCFSRYVGTISGGDEYLVLGQQAYNLLGDEKILEFFKSDRTNVCGNLSAMLFEENPSGSYSIIHIKAKKSLRWLWISLLSILGIAAILFLIFGI